MSNLAWSYQYKDMPIGLESAPGTFGLLANSITTAV